MKKVCLIILIFIPNLIIAQSMYDNWIAGQKAWRFDYGFTAGANSGIQIQAFVPKANRCKYLLKSYAIETGVYYEGLIFNKYLTDKNPTWQKGGIRAELAFIYYPTLMIPFVRPFIGAGVEAGTRKINDLSPFCADIIGKVGVEILFNKKSGPVYLRVSGKYNKGLLDNSTYILPELSLIIGR